MHCPWWHKNPGRQSLLRRKLSPLDTPEARPSSMGICGQRGNLWPSRLPGGPLQELARNSETGVPKWPRTAAMRDSRPRFSGVGCDLPRVRVAYEPGGRRFESCRARHSLYHAIFDPPRQRGLNRSFSLHPPARHPVPLLGSEAGLVRHAPRGPIAGRGVLPIGMASSDWPPFPLCSH